MRSREPEIPLFDPAAMTRCRRRARLTQGALARRLTVHDNQIYRWEKGKTPISAHDLRRVAAQLHVTPAQLQYRLEAPATLADLRSLMAVTHAELACRLAVHPHRLAMWEQGHLGPEHGPLLAAILGISEDAVDHYHHTGTLPAAIAHRLARALHITPALAASAFHAGRVTASQARAA